MGMDFVSVALQMVTVSLPILLGWAIAKLGLMSEQFERELSRLLLQVALPCLTLSSAMGDVELPSFVDTFVLIGITTLLYAVAIVVALVVTALMRVPKGTEGVYQFMAIFGNCGFIGFPVITAILGKQALLYAAIGLIPANIFMFTIAIMLFSGLEGGIKRQLRNLASCFKTPGLLASLAVLVMVLTGLTDWGVLGDSITIVGNMTTPCALLLMGSSISKYNPVSMLTNWRAYVVAACRLLVAPLIGLALLRLWPGLNPLFITTLVLEVSMPVGSNGTLYCIQYNKDALPMMQGTFISIVASIVTIPLITVLASM